MTENKPAGSGQTNKGRAFFDRADEVASTGNWDFAIELYSQGIQREPGNLERGHIKLRDIALQRKGKGGKGPGLKDQWSHRPAKEPEVTLANASFLLGKDPGSSQYAAQVLRAAVKLELPEVIGWISSVIIEQQHTVKKPNRALCEEVIKATETIEFFEHAIKACNLALQAAPDTPALEDKLAELSARFTIQRGKYGDESTSFTEAIADKERQKELMEDDATFKSDEYLQKQIERATKEYEAEPHIHGKINALADALLQYEDESYEAQAIDVLAKAWRDTGAYQFKFRIGDIKIKQFRRRVREQQEKGDKEAAKKLAVEQLKFEIDEYKERTENYPTDLKLKYEYGRRMYMVGQLDEAITILQQAQRNPSYHARSMNYLGQAFMKKKWWQEAVDTFEKVLKGEISEAGSKDIRYNLSLCYIEMKRLKEAQEQLSLIAQIDFNFKDVRKKLEQVRDMISENQ